MIVPISVMPAVSYALAPHCSSISALVCGIEPAGSPDRISRLTFDPRRSTPSRSASWARRIAYVGVAATTVAPKSMIWRTRASVVCAPPGHVEDADLLHRVVKAPEADERPVPERDVGDVVRPHAATPDPVAPHLGDPRPVLARVERAERAATGRPRGGVDANRPLAPDHRDLAVRRRRVLRGHPLVPGQERNPAEIVDRRELRRVEPLVGKATLIPRAPRGRPLALAAQLGELERLDPLPIKGLGLRVPVGALRRHRGSAREYLTLLRTSMSSIVGRAAPGTGIVGAAPGGSEVSCASRRAMTPHRIVNAPELGEPSGFSHAVVAGGTAVYLAGQIGSGETFGEQFERRVGQSGARAPRRRWRA